MEKHIFCETCWTSRSHTVLDTARKTVGETADFHFEHEDTNYDVRCPECNVLYECETNPDKEGLPIPEEESSEQKNVAEKKWPVLVTRTFDDQSDSNSDSGAKVELEEAGDLSQSPKSTYFLQTFTDSFLLDCFSCSETSSFSSSYSSVSLFSRRAQARGRGRSASLSPPRSREKMVSSFTHRGEKRSASFSPPRGRKRHSSLSPLKSQRTTTSPEQEIDQNHHSEGQPTLQVLKNANLSPSSDDMQKLSLNLPQTEEQQQVVSVDSPTRNGSTFHRRSSSLSILSGEATHSMGAILTQTFHRIQTGGNNGKTKRYPLELVASRHLRKASEAPE